MKVRRGKERRKKALVTCKKTSNVFLERWSIIRRIKIESIRRKVGNWREPGSAAGKLKIKDEFVLIL